MGLNSDNYFCKPDVLSAVVTSLPPLLTAHTKYIAQQVATLSQGESYSCDKGDPS